MIKKIIINILIIVAVLSLARLLDTDSNIYRNIRLMDKADSVQLVCGNNATTLPFDKEMIDLVSYSGFIEQTDNLFEYVFMPYSNKLEKVDLTIYFIKDDKVLDKAFVYHSPQNNKYILHMNNVYWEKNENLYDLLEKCK